MTLLTSWCSPTQVNVMVSWAGAYTCLPVKVLAEPTSCAVERAARTRQAIGAAWIAPAQRKLAVITGNVGRARQVARLTGQHEAVGHKCLELHLHGRDVRGVATRHLGAIPSAQSDELREVEGNHGAWQPGVHGDAAHERLSRGRRGDSLPGEGGTARHLHRVGVEEFIRFARALAQAFCRALIAVSAGNAAGGKRVVAGSATHVARRAALTHINELCGRAGGQASALVWKLFVKILVRRRLVAARARG